MVRNQVIPDNAISDFLNTSLVDLKFFVLDYWMFIHLLSGFALGWFIKDWKKILVILIAWELFEVLFWGVFFKQESFINILWDIVFGMMGWGVTQLIIMRSYPNG